MKRKKNSGKNFQTGPTITALSFRLVGEIILSEKGSSKSQVRIIAKTQGLEPG